MWYEGFWSETTEAQKICVARKHVEEKGEVYVSQWPAQITFLWAFHKFLKFRNFTSLTREHSVSKYISTIFIFKFLNLF